MRTIQNHDIYIRYIESLICEYEDLVSLLYADQLREGLPVSSLYRSLSFSEIASDLKVRTRQVRRQIMYVRDEKEKQKELEKKKNKEALDALVAQMKQERGG